jgi:hypothetical protein
VGGPQRRVTYLLAVSAAALLGSSFTDRVPTMNCPRHSTARSAFGAARPLVLGVIGGMGKRSAGLAAPAPI